MTRLRMLLIGCVCATLLAGCGTDGEGAAIEAVTGTAVVFDFDAALDDRAHFYDFPYPSDLRLSAAGTPALDGFPGSLGILATVKAVAQQRRGFPTTAAGYFRFTAPVAAQDIAVQHPGDPASPILLLDIDPTSPERGRLFPTTRMFPATCSRWAGFPASYWARIGVTRS